MANGSMGRRLLAVAVLTRLLDGVWGTGRGMVRKAAAPRRAEQVTLWGAYDASHPVVIRRHLVDRAGGYSYQSYGYEGQTYQALGESPHSYGHADYISGASRDINEDYGYGYEEYAWEGSSGVTEHHGHSPGGELAGVGGYLTSEVFGASSLMPFAVWDFGDVEEEAAPANEPEPEQDTEDITGAAAGQVFDFDLTTRTVPEMGDVSHTSSSTAAPTPGPTPAHTSPAASSSPTQDSAPLPFLPFSFTERSVPGMGDSGPTEGPAVVPPTTEPQGVMTTGPGPAQFLPFLFTARDLPGEEGVGSTSEPSPSPLPAQPVESRDGPVDNACLLYRVFFVLNSKPFHRDVDFVAELLPSFGSAYGVLQELESEHVYDWLNHEVLPSTCQGFDRFAYDSTPFSMTTPDWGLALEVFRYVSGGELLEDIREQDVFCGVVLANDKVRIESTDVCVEEERELEQRTAGTPRQIPGMFGQDPIWVWNPGEN